jgi:hypothetical protein
LWAERRVNLDPLNLIWVMPAQEMGMQLATRKKGKGRTSWANATDGTPHPDLFPKA